MTSSQQAHTISILYRLMGRAVVTYTWPLGMCPPIPGQGERVKVAGRILTVLNVNHMTTVVDGIYEIELDLIGVADKANE